jgi:hypothetical protein
MEANRRDGGGTCNSQWHRFTAYDRSYILIYILVFTVSNYFFFDSTFFIKRGNSKEKDITSHILASAHLNHLHLLFGGAKQLHRPSTGDLHATHFAKPLFLI